MPGAALRAWARLRHPLGEAFSGADQKFARLQRMVAATQRALKEAQLELERIRNARIGDQAREVTVN